MNPVIIMTDADAKRLGINARTAAAITSTPCPGITWYLDVEHLSTRELELEAAVICGARGCDEPAFVNTSRGARCAACAVREGL